MPTEKDWPIIRDAKRYNQRNVDGTLPFTESTRGVLHDMPQNMSVYYLLHLSATEIRNILRDDCDLLTRQGTYPTIASS